MSAFEEEKGVSEVPVVDSEASVINQQHKPPKLPALHIAEAVPRRISEVSAPSKLLPNLRLPKLRLPETATRPTPDVQSPPPTPQRGGLEPSQLTGPGMLYESQADQVRPLSGRKSFLPTPLPQPTCFLDSSPELGSPEEVPKSAGIVVDPEVPAEGEARPKSADTVVDPEVPAEGEARPKPADTVVDPEVPVEGEARPKSASIVVDPQVLVLTEPSLAALQIPPLTPELFLKLHREIETLKDAQRAQREKRRKLRVLYKGAKSEIAALKQENANLKLQIRSLEMAVSGESSEEEEL